MSAAQPKSAERRNHYRLKSPATLRLRDLDPLGPGLGGGDQLASFDVLCMAASRFRKEASPAGRSFVDAVMATLDSLVGQASQDGSGAGGWHAARVLEVNLSAGGMGFLWEHGPEPAPVVEVEFSLECDLTSVPFRLASRVVRCHSVSQGFDVGLEFLDMAGPSQQRLVRLLFDLQRQRLRHGADR